MGYYSLYRIVKDITRTIFGHKFWRKFLIVCLLAFAIWFFMHSKGYCVEETEDINYKVYNYYDSILYDFIQRFNKGLQNNDSNTQDILDAINSGNSIYLCYGATDGSSYINGQPVSRSYLSAIVGNGSNIIANREELTSDYMSVTGFGMFKSNQAHFIIRFTVDGVTNKYSYTNGQHYIYFPLELFNYKNSYFVEYINAVNNGDNQTIIDLLEDIKEETQTTNDILTDSSIDNSVISDLNSGYTATSEDITNNDSTFQLGETKENAWLTQFKTAFNGLSYRLPSTINLTLPYVNKNLGIRSDILSSHITGTQFETIVIAFWWVFFGMRIYRLVKRIVIHFASGEILNSEAQQSGPWKLHELLQYEIDRVGLDTFI